MSTSFLWLQIDCSEEIPGQKKFDIRETRFIYCCHGIALRLSIRKI